MRGACRALGVTSRVTSPTFTIGHRYLGRVDVSHLDLYRFRGFSAAEWGDLEPYFDDAVVFVEWPEAGAGALPSASCAGAARARRPRCPARRGRYATTRRLLEEPGVLILAFDTATDLATSALVDDGELLGERVVGREDVCSRMSTRCCDRRRRRPRELDASSSAPGPGSFTSTRIGLAVARGLGLGLGIEGAGVSTLDALAGRCRGALAGDRCAPRRGVRPGPRRGAAGERGRCRQGLCVGNGAVRYRDVLEASGALVPQDDDPRHVPLARLHAGLATSFGPVDAIEPLYVRSPDADRWLPVILELRRLVARRPRRDRGDRAGVVSDAVVALDVRVGAREAELPLVRRRRRHR